MHRNMAATQMHRRMATMRRRMAEFPLKSVAKNAFVDGRIPIERVAKNASQNDRRNRMNSGTQWPFEEWPNPRECIEEWIAELPTPERRRHEMVPISARNGRNLKMDPNGRARKDRMAENEQRHSKGRPFRLLFRDPALAQPAAYPCRDSTLSQPVCRPLRGPFEGRCARSGAL